MPNKIKFRRGNKSLLPALAQGEPALCLDTKEVFIGGNNGNIQLATQEQVDSSIAKKANLLPLIPTNLPLAAGIKSYGPCYYTKDQFGLATICINISYDSPNTYIPIGKIASLPAGYRPDRDVRGSIYTQWGSSGIGEGGCLNISNTGEVSIIYPPGITPLWAWGIFSFIATK